MGPRALGVEAESRFNDEVFPLQGALAHGKAGHYVLPVCLHAIEAIYKHRKMLLR
jgi:hypothetical protein